MISGKQYRQPPHVGRAKKIVHQYEFYLCQAIDEAMVAQYGESWQQERLPLCGVRIKNLIKKWQEKGGNALDHADYVHYVAIMVQAEHFESIFSIGFEEPAIIEDLIEKARNLRAASHHPRHPFTPEDLRDLRVTWNAIKKALRSLEPCIAMVS